MADLVPDPSVQKAVSRIMQRAERQQSLDRLADTFVDPGISVQIDNDNNQILYGRRGTGKTHVLKVLQLSADAVEGDLGVYIDMRTLGSSHVYEDTSKPMWLRVNSLLRDVLEQVQEAFVEEATSPTSGASTAVLAKLGLFEASIRRSILADETYKEGSSLKEQDTSGSKINAGLSASGIPSLGGELSAQQGTETQQSVEVAGGRVQSMNFQNVATELESAIEALGISRLVLLLDEWTAVPLDLQPLLADFLKRVVMPSASVTIKIASIEYRSNFSIPLGKNNVLGFEMSADISSSLELDDYYVYDRNREQTTANFGELLYKHVRSELSVLEEGDHLKSAYSVSTEADFRRRLFASPEAFTQLVRAGEGVSRDFINIFSGAFFDALKRGRGSVDLQAVRGAARDWYEKDKAENIDDAQAAVLRRIINEVIGEKRARSFMLEKSLEGHDMIRSLFDLRVIHLVRRGYAAKDNPGVRYNIYTLDFGTYVDLMGTKKAPQEDFEDDETDIEIVPFDDMKSIRRIILREAHLGPVQTPLFAPEVGTSQ